jgi:hypothetical protein
MKLEYSFLYCILFILYIYTVSYCTAERSTVQYILYCTVGNVIVQ